MKKITYKPIGVIHSPFKEPKGTPIQPEGARGIDGTVEVFAEYAEGLKDVEGFSHIILIYHFHLSKGASLTAKPFMDSKPRGVFAMRGPSRPNPIGISVVRLVRIEPRKRAYSPSRFIGTGGISKRHGVMGKWGFPTPKWGHPPIDRPYCLC